MNIVNLYPTPVGTYELEDVEEMNKGLAEFLYNMRSEGIDKTNQYTMSGPQGFHTDFSLLKSDNFYIKLFHAKITEQIVFYYEYLTGENLNEKNVTLTSWGMIYGPGDHSLTHTHPAADIATAYYVKVPNNMLNDWRRQNDEGLKNSLTTVMPGSFNHIDPRPAARWDFSFSKNSDNTVEVNEGTGTIFPGWLEHFVTPHYVEEDRICIATNVFICKC
jgi:uncharacterized protein (TIGR02466 family)